ncbi:hypothetical protein [Neorhizobium sp. JUb45]|uniref:hypothetical protein n=1 Tax=unclassified Neorhizobium TaxID=2629175 RepID=UPI00105385DC|nr:hypothetical protein [Neorhizobium sp. JUb45]TCR04055.1 hypothetical protein EDF70_102151 [Neorhizobium sp. JUb45]
MVEPVTRISASAASEATRIDSSLSITSEPDNAWVAARQEQITADQQRLRRDAADEKPDGAPPHHAHTAAETSDQPEEQRLSGESERIGNQNFDDDTPFGERVVIL